MQQCLGSVSPWLKFQMPPSRLGSETEHLGLGPSLDTEGLGLGLGSKRLDLVGKHISITCIKLCLNMPLWFSLSSRLPPLPFRTTSDCDVFRGANFWPSLYTLGLLATLINISLCQKQTSL